MRNAGLFGAESWILHPGTHSGLSWVYPGIDWKTNQYALRRLDRLGRQMGIEVLIENISARNAILSRPNEFARLYQEWFRAPRMVLDVGHSHVRNDTEMYFKRLGRKIVHIHAHDNDDLHDQHLAIGAGTLDWKKLSGLMRRFVFEGTVIVESARNPFGSLARLKRLFGSV